MLTTTVVNENLPEPLCAEAQLHSQARASERRNVAAAVGVAPGLACNMQKSPIS